MAADLTITNTGGLKWKYADAIIRSWHGKGLHTPEEIAAGDKKERPSRGRTKRTAASATAPSSEDDKALARLARLREEMKTNE